ncbi:hypothetical protein GCM10009847_07570 [Leucobacter tardus]|nr:thioredoxin domain-containing protein [Leucobacter tardus]
MLIAIPSLILVVGIIILVAVLNRPAAGDAGSAGVDAVQPNSRYLDEVGEDAPTLVEFLDFECGACGGIYPAMEQIRERYDGEINYAIRYFPIPSHANGLTSAIAVEAAAEQGELEAMYRMMFETQSEWGGQQESQADRFRGYAEQIGLDMEAYDAAVADPETEARVEQDRLAGQALGISGTPTFFLDGEVLELTQESDLTGALDRAIEDRGGEAP